MEGGEASHLKERCTRDYAGEREMSAPHILQADRSRRIGLSTQGDSSDIGFLKKFIHKGGGNQTSNGGSASFPKRSRSSQGALCRGTAKGKVDYRAARCWLGQLVHGRKDSAPIRLKKKRGRLKGKGRQGRTDVVVS